MPGLYNKYIRPLHAAGDAVSIALSFALAHQIAPGETATLTLSGYTQLLLYALFAWYTCSLLLGTYKIYRAVSINRLLLNALQVILLYVLLFEVIIQLFDLEAISRQLQFLHYGFLTCFVLFYRFVVLLLLRHFRRKGYNKRFVVIVGMGEAGKELRRFFEQHPEYGYHFMGFFDDKAVGAPDVLGSIEDITAYLEENHIDEIYCSPFELPRNQIIRLMNDADDRLIRMKFLPEPGTFHHTRMKLDFHDMLPVLVFRSIPLDDTFNKVIKRAFDILFSSVVIILVLSWLIPLLALLIKIDSRGPIFFGQERSGINYKTFRCWKLRSMYVNNEANSLLARRGDSRITRVGAFLRKTSLDELPQFFNVFMGQMSIVGPRPHMLKVNEEYAMVAEKYMVRHFIKPGITGLSQVRGYRGDTSSDYQIRGRVKLDIFYLENWSFFLDLKIVFYTVYNMLRGEDNAF